MNITRLNGVKDVIIERDSGGSASDGMKYYDCLYDEEEHGDYIVDSAKWVDIEGNCVIGSEAYLGTEWARLVAVAVDMTNRKVYKDGKWMSQKEWLIETDGFNPDTHTEITEEEFYRLPIETEFIPYKDYKKAEEVYKTIWKALEKYGITDNILEDKHWSELDSIDIPIMACGFKYKNISMQYSSGEENEPYIANIVTRIWVMNDVGKTNSSWFDYDTDDEDAKYAKLINIILGNYFALSKGINYDGSVEYFPVMLLG